MKIVAVTSCPTGIAHTYMAAEALEQAAKDAGHDIKVETQGAAGAEAVADADIAAADAVVFAADVEVRNRERFAGKPLVQTSVKRAINDAHRPDRGGRGGRQGRPVAATATPTAGAAMPAARWPRPAPAAAEAAGAVGRPPSAPSCGGWLMTGVSYMIPFVAAGGILIALGFLFGGGEVATRSTAAPSRASRIEAITDLYPGGRRQAGWAGLLFLIGATAFSMLVPDPGRLHRLRDGRPARSRPRHRRPGCWPTWSAPGSSAAWSAVCWPAPSPCTSCG